MATKTKDSATTEFVDTAREQLLSVLEEGHSLILDGYRQWLEICGNLPTPSFPGFDSINVVTAESVDGVFDFGTEVLDRQRAFAKDLIALGSQD